MASTESEAELHEFAARIGLKREWYQAPPRHRSHYDLSRTARERAVLNGAVEVSSRELVLRNFDCLPCLRDVSGSMPPL